MNHHVIAERVLLIQHLAADLAGVSLAIQYLVFVGHVAVLCGIPPVPTTKGTQPLFVSVHLATEFCNKIKPHPDLQRVAVKSQRKSAATWMASVRYS